MELDFKGTWRTLDDNLAHVETFEKDFWRGTINGVQLCWDIEGRLNPEASNCIPWDGFDLMERISERWSSERSGGENG